MSITDALFTTIRTDHFKLEEMLSRIEFFYAKGEVSDTDRANLIFAARQHAADAMDIDPKAEIQALVLRINELEKRLKAVEEQLQPEPEPEPEPEPDIPDYVQPTGAHDAYNIGDKVKYKDRYYECKMNGCVWAPDVYPAAWEEIFPNEDGDEE